MSVSSSGCSEGLTDECEDGNAPVSHSVCTCKTLEAVSIAPEKCKVNELRLWLKSRCQRVRAKETKLELVIRVKKCLEQDIQLPIVDPHPDQPYHSTIRANCKVCTPKARDSDQPPAGTNTTQWSKSTHELPLFSYLDILEYSKKSGKNTNYMEKPIEKGYAFHFDGYVFNEEVSSHTDGVNIRAKCYRSLKKSEKPHALSVKLNSAGTVINGNCSCVAGAGGHCNHIYALLYSIDHTKKMKFDTFNRHSTCTDKPAEWTKRRTDGVRSNPVMTATVIRPKYGSTSKGIKTTLYEARNVGARQNLVLTKETMEKLARINPLFGVCATVGSDAQDRLTRMGFSTPQGSPLSYQLAPCEANFRVTENINNDIMGKNDVGFTSVPNFPWSNTDIQEIAPEILREVDISLDIEAANVICQRTVNQSYCELWHSVREKRLTASKFGAILKRKKTKKSL